MAISSTTSAAAAGTGTSFNVDGVISGLNTSALITQLMTLSQAPLNQLTAQQTAVKARDTAYQSISSQLISFQGSVQNLLLSTSINAKLSASTVPTVATATADASAINGNFSMTVANLATATSVTSSGGPNSGRLGTQATLDSSPTSTALLTGTGAGGVGMAITPTAGTFTVNGQKVTLAVGDNWAALQAKLSALTGPAVTLNVVPGSNSVSLTSASPMQLGTSTDTSNFLSAAKLLGAAQTGSTLGGYTVASNQLLGEAQPVNSLATAGLSTALTSASGDFAVNGVSISWANTDSISDVLTRINSSAAGVTASYDPKLDKVSLTNSNTGAQGISLVDGTGNLLQAMNLTAAPQVAGVPAQYTTTQNGIVSATQFSNSNVISNIVQGVRATLLSAGTTSLTTTQDSATATKNIQTFITQFNSMVDVLDAATANTTATSAGGVLAGDPTITGLANQLRSIVTSAGVVPAGSAYHTMGDIGISTGAFGSAVGTTNHLVLDTGKLTTALQSNPQAVSQLLSGLSGNATLAGDPSSSALLQSAGGSPFGQVNSGTYKVTFNPATLTLTSQFTSAAGTISPASTGLISAGGSNTSLIPGISMVAQSPLPVLPTTATINYTVSSRGIFQTLNDYINQSRGPSGVFTAESRNATSAEKDLTAQIANQNLILAARKTSLQAQFTAMEVALASLQSQGAALSSSLGVASTTAAANSASSSSSQG
jgi:flagellar hook-associated protein 2